MLAHAAETGSPLRVVLAEDEALLAEELRDRLGRMGLEVAGVAVRGDEAVALASSVAPDLILMDVHLKGAMDGVEAAAIIRSRVDVPIVYLTAHSDEETIHRAQETGPFGYLVKPVADHHLRAAIAIALGRHTDEKRLRQAGENLKRSNDALRESATAAAPAAPALRDALHGAAGLLDLLRGR